MLEKGEMDIKDGRGRGVENYEELWEDLEDPDGMEKIGWVLSVDGERGKGMCVRVGRRVQGVVRMGMGKEVVSVVRWRFVEESGWVKEVEIGEFPLGAEIFGDLVIKVGDIAQGLKGLEWECLESFTWD